MVVAGQAFGEGGHGVGDTVDRHGQADDAGGIDHDLGGLQAEGETGGDSHGFGILNTTRTGAGVGVATIDNDGADVVRLEVRLADADRGGLDLIGGESSGGDAGRRGIDQPEIEPRFGGIFNPGTDGVAEKAFRSADAPGDFFIWFGFQGHGLAAENRSRSKE